MDKGREKEAFVTVKIKAATAHKFRIFCKNNAASQSMSLHQMIQFFEFNGIAPTDNLGDSIAKLEGKINKRTNAIIAIIKDIEKNQTKPTTAMLLSLFEEKAKQEKPKLVERKFVKVQTDKEFIEVTVPKVRYERLENNMKSVKKDFIYVLDKVKVVNRSFGKGYLKLELTEGELVKFRRSINHY
tara:strand:- start:21 stop:575 length:555 start_codon:yes stop_codon:yes gene_type:complete